LGIFAYHYLQALKVSRTSGAGRCSTPLVSLDSQKKAATFFLINREHNFVGKKNSTCILFQICKRYSTREAATDAAGGWRTGVVYVTGKKKKRAQHNGSKPINTHHVVNTHEVGQCEREGNTSLHFVFLSLHHNSSYFIPVPLSIHFEPLPLVFSAIPFRNNLKHKNFHRSIY